MSSFDPNQPSPHSPPNEAEEERVMLDRAEEAWQRQVEREEAITQEQSRYGQVFRWLFFSIAGLALIYLLFTRLAELG